MNAGDAVRCPDCNSETAEKAIVKLGGDVCLVTIRPDASCPWLAAHGEAP
jgi:hypothetical protein